MTGHSAHAISVVLATDGLDTVHEVLAALRAQPIRDRIELVLVCPVEARLGDGVSVEGIGATRVVEVASLVPLEEAVAAGVRVATAPVVLVAETHAFPDPGAFEPILRALEDEGYAAVAPGLRNGNRETAASWASLMATYGRTLGGARREVDTLSTHNTCYRRDLLTAFGSELPTLLQVGGGLDARLRAAGHRLLYEPAATFAHLNVVPLRSCFFDRYYVARCYAAARSRSWTVARRALYALGSPLIPFVLGMRIVRSRGWAAHRHEFPRGVWLPFGVSLVAIAAGELAAYLNGVGGARARVIEYEIHRARHI